MVANSEELTEDLRDESTEDSIDKSTEEEGEATTYICGNCGKTIVPQPFETPTGTRYRCPECNRITKPLTKEEVEAKKEEKELGPLPPTEIIMLERVKELLQERLPTVYGIPKKEASKRITAILDTLNPRIAMEPFNLHNHIKIYAPNADERHLESIIKKLFWDLEAEGYLPKDEFEYRPSYSSGRRNSRRSHDRGFPGYSTRSYGRTVRYPRGRSYPEYTDDDDDYDDGPPRTRKYSKRDERMTIVVDNQEIETDYAGYMAYKRFQAEEKKAKREEREHELKMKKLEAEILKITKEAETHSKKDVPLVKVEGKDGQELEVPASVAHMYLTGGENKEALAKIVQLEEKLEKERNDRHQIELENLKSLIENRPSLEEQIAAVQHMAPYFGYHQGSKTTLEVLEKGLDNFNQRAQQVLSRVTGIGGDFKPEVTRTPEERKMKAEEIEQKLQKTEEILEAEDDLIRAMAQVER